MTRERTPPTHQRGGNADNNQMQPWEPRAALARDSAAPTHYPRSSLGRSPTKPPRGGGNTDDNHMQQLRVAYYVRSPVTARSTKPVYISAAGSEDA